MGFHLLPWDGGWWCGVCRLPALVLAFLMFCDSGLSASSLGEVVCRNYFPLDVLGCGDLPTGQSWDYLSLGPMSFCTKIMKKGFYLKWQRVSTHGR